MIPSAVAPTIPFPPSARDALERGFRALCDAEKFDEALGLAKIFPKEFDQCLYIAQLVHHYVHSSNWDFNHAVYFARQIPTRADDRQCTISRENAFGSIAIAIVAQKRFEWVRCFDTCHDKPAHLRFDSKVLGVDGYANLQEGLTFHLSQYIKEGRREEAQTMITHLHKTTANVQSLKAMLDTAF